MSNITSLFGSISPDILSEPYLRRRYVKEGVTANRIAADTGSTSRTVRLHLEKYDIPVRSRAEARSAMVGDLPAEQVLTTEFLETECVRSDKSASAVALELGISVKLVTEALRRHGLPVRRASGGPGAAAPSESVLTEEYLRLEYVEKQRTAAAIAAEVGTGHQTVTAVASNTV